MMRHRPLFISVLIVFISLSAIISVAAFDLITVSVRDKGSGSPIQDASVQLEFTDPHEVVYMQYDDGLSCYRAPRDDRFINREAKIIVKFPVKMFGNENRPMFILLQDAKPLIVNHDHAAAEIFAVPYPEYYAKMMLDMARSSVIERKYEEAIEHIDKALKAVPHVSTYQMKSRVLQKALSENPSEPVVGKAKEFVEAAQWEDWGDDDGSERFKAVYELGATVAEIKSKQESVNSVGIKALDLAQSLRPADPRPCCAKYHLLAARRTRQDYEDAAQVIDNFFEKNPTTPDKTAVPFINDWLGYLEAVAGPHGTPSNVATFDDLKRMYAQYKSALQGSLPRKRYEFAAALLSPKAR
jgi:tetratricopeptide (TPR) repeat protein